MSFVVSGWVEGDLVEVDGLFAGVAAAGPAFEDRLEQVDCPWEGQAGRW
jgi:hypothetical protein